jgi:hypothetical protein
MVMKSTISCDITPCSPLSVNRRFGEAKIGPVSCLVYSSNLKMGATCPSETPVDFQQTTRHYISEDRTIQLGILQRKAFNFDEFMSGGLHEEHDKQLGAWEPSQNLFDIIHGLVFVKNNVSETGFCLCHQVNAYSVGPNRKSLSLSPDTRVCCGMQHVTRSS